MILCRVHFDKFDPDCFLCKRAAFHESQRKGGNDPVAEVVDVAVPERVSATGEIIPSVPAEPVSPWSCKFAGDQLTSEECMTRGLTPLKTWLLCEHPEKPLGIFVCPCIGCGPNCRGYQNEEG